MKIQVIGLGVVGSSVANNLIMQGFDISELYLCDIDKNKLLGEFRDLSDAKRILGRDMKIIPTNKPEKKADFHIVCIGERFYLDSMLELMPDNYNLVKRTVWDIKEGKILIVTNPSDTITQLLKLDGLDVECMGDVLDDSRKNMGYNGKDIRLLKGHTNWGISAEVIRYIKEYGIRVLA